MNSGKRDDDATTGAAKAEKVDLKFEAVVIPVADVYRAKAFYEGSQWRLDADFAFDNGFRVVQFTPPGSYRHRSSSARSSSPRPSPARRRVSPSPTSRPPATS